jgi:hypothetical protein
VAGCGLRSRRHGAGDSQWHGSLGGPLELQDEGVFFVNGQAAATAFPDSPPTGAAPPGQIMAAEIRRHKTILGTSRQNLLERSRSVGKYPPAEPGALLSEPLKAAGRGCCATPVTVASSRNNSRGRDSFPA